MLNLSDRYRDIEDLKLLVLKGGNIDPFFKRYNLWKLRITENRKSKELGVIVKLDNNNLIITRNPLQPKPNQDKDFKKVVSISKDFGFQILNMEYKKESM